MNIDVISDYCDNVLLNVKDKYTIYNIYIYIL